MQAQVTAEHELWHFLEQIAFYSIILPLLFMFDISKIEFVFIDGCVQEWIFAI